MKRALLFILIFALAVPVSLVSTIILAPFWNWFEASSGIESIGHSGPANWCFGVVFILTLCVGMSILIFIRGRKKPD